MKLNQKYIGCSGFFYKDWKEKIDQLNIKMLFVFFNNDHHANAVFNAHRLKEMMR